MFKIIGSTKNVHRKNSNNSFGRKTLNHSYIKPLALRYCLTNVENIYGLSLKLRHKILMILKIQY